jgi:hypothetical protein
MAVSAVAQYRQGKAAVRAQKEQVDISRAQQAQELRRQRLGARQRAYAAQATAIAAGEAAGAAGSSGEAGAAASIQTQMKAQETYLSGAEFLGGEMAGAQKAEASAKYKMGLWQQVGELAGMGFSATGGAAKTGGWLRNFKWTT